MRRCVSRSIVYAKPLSGATFSKSRRLTATSESNRTLTNACGSCSPPAVSNDDTDKVISSPKQTKRGGKRTTVKLGALSKRSVDASEATVDGDVSQSEPSDASTQLLDNPEGLPQGVVQTGATNDSLGDQHLDRDNDDTTVTGYPRVIQQARDNMAKFSQCVVLTRVGGFYELYFHQAEHWASQLSLKLASKKTARGPVSMAGFPASQLERYLKALVQDHRVHVALAEEVANDASQRVKSGGLMFNREIKRIVTPGTLIDETFLAPNQHNYLLGICKETSEPNWNNTSVHCPQLCLAWLDLSSGEFMTQVTSVAALGSVLARVAPREIVVELGVLDIDHGSVAAILEDQEDKISHFQDLKESYDATTSPFTTTSDVSDSTQGEARAARALLQYIERQLPGIQVQLRHPQRYEAKHHMGIDKNTLRGLEISKTLKDGSEKGSLLNVIRRTSTKSGARLLSQRLVSPSMSLQEIEERLDLIQELLQRPFLIDEIASLLKRTTDSPRVVQAIVLGKGDAQDLLNLANTILLTKSVADIVKQETDGHSVFTRKADEFRWNGPLQLTARIQGAIDEDGLMARYRVRENEVSEAATLAQEAIAAEGAEDMAALHKRLGAVKRSSSITGQHAAAGDEMFLADDLWIMRRTASLVLAQLHDHLSTLRQEVQQLAIDLQERLQAKSLTLKVSPGLGYVVHVKGRDIKSDFSQVIKEARIVSQSKSTRSFILPEWTSLGRRIEDAKLQIRAEEQQIFRVLRSSVCENIVALRRNAGILDELDVACSSAILARERNLIRPILDESQSMHIVDGRHMTVEAGLHETGRSFTPNDTSIGQTSHNKRDEPNTGDDTRSIHLITGPNMAGKSTYLRQIALISILAQTGLYVPASYAKLGLVDAVFSRIGSADNLYHDQSTFMVEMLETSQILNSAGPRSLVVMDEVGRGTSPEHGVAVGYAVLETLRQQRVGRVMFATHFQKILDMCLEWREVACLCTRVVEGPASSFRFNHKMRPGINRDSHALKVAKLAGLPRSTIKIAQEVLENLGA